MKKIFFILITIILFAKNGVAMDAKFAQATVGGGCFWCIEAIYDDIKGVVDVVSGYAGGNVKEPTYKEVCSQKTGHAEVVNIVYDPKQISYKELLEIFWKIHDPTTLNRQGADVGTQYRSVILYRSEEEKKIAQKSKQEAQKNFSEPIVTEIIPLIEFWPAEEHHQDFFKKNPYHGYCRAVVAPKVEKAKKDLNNLIK